MILQEGEYLIPDGFTVKQVDRTVCVYKTMRNTLAEDDHRCRDCKHFTNGYSINSKSYMTTVCSKQPRGVGRDGRERFKAVQKYCKPCEEFKQKEK